MRFLVLIALAGCGVFGQPQRPDDAALLEQAQAKARVLFQAAAEGDCDTIGPLVPGLKDPKDCQEFVEEVAHTELELHAISGAKVDGRDPNAVIVKCETLKGGKPTQILVRAVWSSDGWAIHL